MEIEVVDSVQGRVQQVDHGDDQGGPWIPESSPGDQIKGNSGDGQQDRLDNEQGGGILVQSVDRRQQVVEGLEMVAQMIEGDPEGDPGIPRVKQCVEGLMLPAQIKGVGVKGAMPAEAPAINTVSAGRSLNAAPLRRVAP